MTSLRHCGDHWSELLPLLEHNRPTFLVFSWGPVSFSDKLRLCLISTERERERGSGKCFFHIEIDTLKHIIKKNPNGSIKYFWPSVLVSRICTRSSVCNREVENKTSAVAATFSPLPFSHIKRSDCGAWHQSAKQTWWAIAPLHRPSRASFYTLCTTAVAPQQAVERCKRLQNTKKKRLAGVSSSIYTSYYQ